MSVSLTNLLNFNLHHIVDLDPEIGGRVACARAVAFIQQKTPFSSEERCRDVKKTFELLVGMSDTVAQDLRSLAIICTAIKEGLQVAEKELSFLFDLGFHYAEGLRLYERSLSLEDQDLLTDFYSLRASWIRLEPPFSCKVNVEEMWDIPSLIGLYSSLHYCPDPSLIKLYIQSISDHVKNILNTSGALDRFLVELCSDSQSTKILLFDIKRALQHYLPWSFALVERQLLFSFTTPFHHRLYCCLYNLIKNGGSYTQEDLDLCALYVSSLSEKSKRLLLSYLSDEIKVMGPGESETALSDIAKFLTRYPSIALKCLVVDDFFSMKGTSLVTKKIFSKYLGGGGIHTLSSYEPPPSSHPIPPKVEVDTFSLDCFLTIAHFSKSPLFEKLKQKEEILSQINKLLSSADFSDRYGRFLTSLQSEAWVDCCRDNPRQYAHFATIAYFAKDIILQQLLIVHRVSDALLDQTVTSRFVILHSSDVACYLRDANYPPFAYEHALQENPSFVNFISFIDSLSCVERTCVEYSLKEYSPNNVERFIIEIGGYREGMKGCRGVKNMELFHILLPPAVNVALYNTFLPKEQHRSMDDFVFGFGFSQDPFSFYMGKRPISIASPYFSMEDLSNFKIHGFSQPCAKGLGLDFHDCAYHIPLEMNFKKEELAFLGFAAEAVGDFSSKLFLPCTDPVQKIRYEKIFKIFHEILIDRETFVASNSGALLNKEVALEKMNKYIHHHPLVKHHREDTPSYDRLDIIVEELPERVVADRDRYVAYCLESLTEDRTPSIRLRFRLKKTKFMTNFLSF